MKKAIAFLSLVLFAGAVQAQKVEVPFVWENGTVFLYIDLEGIVGKYMVDTGAPMAVTHQRAQKKPLKELGKMPIIDAYGNRSEGLVVAEADSMVIGNVSFHGLPMQLIVLKEGDGLEATGSDGIVGSNFLTQFVVRFDSRQESMFLSRSIEPYGIKEKKYGIPMRVSPTGHVYVDVEMGKGVAEEVMFDTGSSDFLSFSDDAYERLMGASAIDSIVMVNGSAGVPDVGHKAIKGYVRTKVPKLDVGRGKFADATADVLPGGKVTLLGVKLLKYGIVTLDYPNKRFYFEPYSRKRVDAYEPMWDIMIGSYGNKLYVNRLWSDVDPHVEPGDKVVSVDGVVYEGDDAVKFLRLQREGTATEREVLIHKKDSTEFTVISRKR